MATTEHFYTGNNSTTSFAFTFPYLSNSDVKVELDNVVKTENSSGQTNNDYTINNTNIVFNSAPGTGVAIHIYRTTNVDTAQAQYAAGSSIRAADLNNNQTQLLYSAQEAGGQLIRQTDLKDSIVNSAKIADGSIATGDLADSLITTAKIANSNVTTAKIADSNVTTAKIADSNVTTAKIAADAITGAKIADDSINSEHYVDGSIDTAHIADGQVTHVKLANDAVDGDNISDDSINSEHYVDGSIDTAHIADSQVTTAKLASDAVTTVKITDLNVTTAKIAADAITGAKIADDAVDSEHLAADSIDAEHYAAGSVDTTALGADAVTGAKIADDAVDSEHLAADSIDAEHYAAASVDATALASNAVTTGKITDANVTTDKLAADSVTIAKIGCEQTTISDSDSHIPTSGAVVDYVAAQLAPIGGLEVIADDESFPNTIPSAGVVISISDAAGLQVNSSGVSTNADTLDNSTVTINGFPSELRGGVGSNPDPYVFQSGAGLMVQSTGSSHTYNYHQAMIRESDFVQLSDDINDFNNRYRVNAGEPGSNNDEGDLVFDTNANKMKVYDGSSWGEVTSTGDFKYLFLCPAGGTGAPTLNGSIATYDLRESSNSGSAASVSSAAQLVVSVNGVVQKANTGTSAPSEGFALVDANTIVFGANLASGDSVFIIQIGSAVSIPTPGDGTVSAVKIASGAVTTAKIADANVTTAKIADDAVTAAKLASDAVVTASIVDANVTTAKIAGDAITGAKIADDAIDSEHYTDGSIDTAHIADDAVTADKLANAINTDIAAKMPLAGGTFTDDVIFAGTNVNIQFDKTADAIEFLDNAEARFGTGDDLKIYHDGSHSYIKNTTGDLILRDDTIQLKAVSTGDTYLSASNGGGVDIRYDNSTKFQTTSAGVTVTGTVTDSKGELRNVPQVTCSSNLVIISSHAGKHILHSGTGGWTINTSTGFAIGDMVTFINHTASAQTLFQAGGVTLYDTTDGATGDHSVAARGMVTAINVASNVFYLSGNIE